MDGILPKLVYAIVKALIDSGALTLLRKAMEEKIIEASKPNEDDQAFVDSAHADGWGDD
jgi:hypothetical protein